MLRMSGAIRAIPTYAFVAWTGGTLGMLLLVLGMHYVASCCGGFRKLVYLYCSICLHGIDWHNFTLVVLMLGMQYVANC